jgi:membrane dipeptidase
MKRREALGTLALLPLAGRVLPQTPAMPDLHRDAFVMDGHTHVMTRELLLGTDIGQRYPDGNVDLPRAREGGVDAMFFSVYTPEDYYPGRFEIKNTFRVVELALDQIRKNEKTIALALNASDIERIAKSGRIAAFLDLEGGYDLHGDLHLLRALYRLGLRGMQLTAHNTTNAFIDACNDVYVWGGINDHGRAVIREMNELGMVINVAHASNDAIIQAAAASRHPIIYSHGGFHAIVDHPRCIADEAARAIAAKGGVIGVHFGSLFNNPKYWAWQKPNTPIAAQPASRPAVPRIFTSHTTSQRIEDVDQALARTVPLNFRGTIPDEYWMHVDQLARVIDYGVRLVGDDHIALGSDLDGGPELPREIRDISDYPQITIAMQNLGYDERRIRKILGLNWLRVIRRVTEGR